MVNEDGSSAILGLGVFLAISIGEAAACQADKVVNGNLLAREEVTLF